MAALKAVSIRTSSADLDRDPEIGLHGHGSKLPAGTSIDFPDHGDLLDGFTAKANLPTPDDVVSKGPGDNADFEEFEKSALLEMKKEMRISDDEAEAMLAPGAHARRDLRTGAGSRPLHGFWTATSRLPPTSRSTGS